MTTDIRCSVCGGHFSSTEDYQNHHPCDGGSLAGASGPYTESEKFAKADGDDQRTAS